MKLNEQIGTYIPDNLIAGEKVPLLLKGITLLKGQGELKRGSVIGLITLAAGESTAKEGNTGDGAITGITLKSQVKFGVYTLKCTTEAVGAGTFAVYEPDGNKLDDATVGVAYVSNQIDFTIDAGETDFKVGDELYIPIIEGSRKGKLVAKASVDGSQIARYILADTIDTTDSDVVAQCYESGLFNRKALIFAANNTAADHEDALRQHGIFLKDNIAY